MEGVWSGKDKRGRRREILEQEFEKLKALVLANGIFELLARKTILEFLYFLHVLTFLELTFTS